MLIAEIPTVDRVLGAHAGVLGTDATGYTHHVYRVANLCVALSPAGAGDVVHLEKIAIAASFHDLGIWTDHTFDYLAPSVRLATAYLRETGHEAWSGEISAMIAEHHKITAYRGDGRPLVEPFRRADLVDLSHGVIRCGLSRTLLRELYTRWPGAGFHRRLLRLAVDRVRAHPLDPLPMVRI